MLNSKLQWLTNYYLIRWPIRYRWECGTLAPTLTLLSLHYLPPLSIICPLSPLFAPSLHYLPLSIIAPFNYWPLSIFALSLLFSLSPLFPPLSIISCLSIVCPSQLLPLSIICPHSLHYLPLSIIDPPH